MSLDGGRYLVVVLVVAGGAGFASRIFKWKKRGLCLVLRTQSGLVLRSQSGFAWDFMTVALRVIGAMA